MTKQIDTLQRNGRLFSTKLQQTMTRLFTTRRLLLVMMSLQLLWLAAIWITGAANKAFKLSYLGIYTVIVTIIILVLPELSSYSFFQRLATIFSNERWLLGMLLGVVLIGGIIYAANQRMWDFDEEGHYAAAEIVATEGPDALFREYAEQGWLGKQHPPMGPLLYGLAVRLLGQGLFQARLLSLVFTIGTGGLTYLIGRDLYGRKTALFAVYILFSFPLFFRLGTAAVVETPLTFFFTLTVFLTLIFVKRPRIWLMIAIGGSVIIGLLFKYTMILIFPIVFSLIGIKMSWRLAIRYFFVFSGIVIVGLIAWLFFTAQNDILKTQIETIWSYAILVTTNPYGRRILFESITNRLPTALGVYNLPLLLFSALLLLTRKQRQDWPILIWIGLVWIPLFLTLPEHRYFMSTFPAVAIAAAVGLQRLPVHYGKIVLLSLLSCAGALYLFVDWFRVAWLFVK